MQVLLEKYPFELAHLAATANFDCGTHDWEREASDWIRGVGADSALEFLPVLDCQIWLYGTEKLGLVGFGSLKKTRWRYPSPTDRAITLSMIPMLGIQTKFRGQPNGEGERHFSEQILDDLAFEALQHRDREPLIGLYVHPENRRAIDFYLRSGFRQFSKIWTNPETGVVYLSMLRELPGDRVAVR